MTLITGKHYWFRQEAERIWRVGYVSQDPDKNQYLIVLDCGSWEVAKMDLNCFEWRELPEPQ
jgi:hypothetical protein